MWMRIKRAHSFSNGIMIYSVRNPKYLAMATIDKDNIIKAQWLSEQVAKDEEKNQDAEYEEKQYKLFSDIYFFMSAPIIVILLLHLIEVEHTFEFLRILDGILIPVCIICFVINFIVSMCISFHFSKDFTDALKFHSAEHMIANAYNKLDRMPSLDELRKYSRFSTACGTNIFTAILIPCIFVLIQLLFRLDPNLCCMLILILEVLLLCGLLNFVQLLTTEPPTDRELKVALEGLRVWLENEQKK